MTQEQGEETNVIMADWLASKLYDEIANYPKSYPYWKVKYIYKIMCSFIPLDMDVDYFALDNLIKKVYGDQPDDEIHRTIMVNVPTIYTIKVKGQNHE